ncbi:MAG: 4Fe-4S binding protein, partial [Methanobrevibacter sp.]|nr:4Fe-4S binding protein [Methanobrevibacter sp.]
GLCADNSKTGALKQIDGKMRYDPSLDIFTALDNLEDDGIGDNNIIDSDMKLAYDLLLLEKESESLNQKSINSCPVSTLKEDIDNGFGLSGYCVSCGKCVRLCDIYNAREFATIEWNGSVSDDCISCGICAELCPKDAITLKKGSIDVDLDKCILCETCGIHCPADAIPKTTMAKKRIAGGFNLIDTKLCMNCKLCYKICPEDAIIDDKDQGIMIVDEDKCIYCGACSNACPAKAFIFEREFKDASE